jgi:hypothetical protein
LESRLKSHRPGQNPAPGAFQDSALSADVTVSNYLSASPTRLVRRAESRQIAALFFWPPQRRRGKNQTIV